MSNLTTPPPAAVVPTQAAADKVAGTPPHSYPSFWGAVLGILAGAVVAVPNDAWVSLVHYAPPKWQTVGVAVVLYGVGQLRLFYSTWRAANTQGPAAGTPVTVAGAKGAS